MSDWEPQIVKIEKIERHPNADNLSIASVMNDYPVIIKTNEFNAGDLAGYINIDSIVPDTQQFYFLCPKTYEKYVDESGQIQNRLIGSKYELGSVPEKYRIIKAKRIRDVYSQGMLINLTDLYDINASVEKEGPVPKVGDSIVDLIGLKKWEEEEEENVVFAKKKKGTNAESPPKGWTIPHYDVNNIRKYLSCLKDGEEICLTEKLHGSNSAYCYDGSRLWIKSRNWFKKFNPDDMWCDIAIRYDLDNKLKQFPNMVFFGEIVGQVKGFRYDSKIEDGSLRTTVHFFDIWDVKSMRYLDYNDRVSIIHSLKLNSVPELYLGPWLGKEHAYTFAEGKSILNPKHIREGTVLVPVKERYESYLDMRLQLKIVGEGYNLLK